MKILSLNLNGKENLHDIEKEVQANIYAYQESKIQLTHKNRINTINIINNKYEKPKERLVEFEKIWNKFFPWLEFPENYFDESKIDYENFQFTLINVHLAGFRSGLRQPLMLVLLERLKAEDLKHQNIILVGDFNAEKVHKKATQPAKSGSRYLDEIINIGFEELKTDDDIKTYHGAKNDEHRYDHAFIKYNEDKHSYKIHVNYFPKDKKNLFF